MTNLNFLTLTKSWKKTEMLQFDSLLQNPRHTDMTFRLHTIATL